MNAIDNKQKSIFLFPGDLYISETPVLYKTVLGSCISVCLYDIRLKRGAMNHFIHPESTETDKNNKFGDISMFNLIRGMLEKGSLKADLRASVFGGASGNSNLNLETPGEKNIKTALAILKKFGIPVIQEATGGCYGRKVLFHSSTNAIDFEKLDSCLRHCKRKTCDRAVGA